MPFLSSRTLFWSLILGGSVIFVCLALIGSLVFDSALTHPTQRSWLATAMLEFSQKTNTLPFFNSIGWISQNDGIFGITIGVLFSIISVASIYLFKIPNIRSTAVQGLAWGYYENYLSGVVEKIAKDNDTFRIIIVLPSYELVERPRFYWARLKVVIQKLGFDLSKIQTDEVFGRDVFTIQKQEAQSMPLFVDLPSTMKVLRRILELEAHMPAGRVQRQKWWRTRFIELRNEFKDTLIDFFGDEGWGNIIFVEGDNSAQFSADIRKIIDDLETEMDGLTGTDNAPDN